MTVSEELIADVHERLIVSDPRASTALSSLQADRSELLRIAHGAYLQTDSTWKWWELAERVALARILWAQRRNPEAVFVLESAAVLYGLPLIANKVEVHISNLGKKNNRTTRLPAIPGLMGTGGEQCRSNNLIRHSFEVPEEDIVEIHGIRVCSLERLIVDLARLRPAMLALVPIDAACAQITAASRFHRELTLQQMDDLRERLWDRVDSISGTRGSVRARDVILWADPFSESPGETLVRWGVGAFGFSRPVTQHEVWTDGRQNFLDAWLPEFKTALEFDGAEKYAGDDGYKLLMKDKRRDDLLQAEGIRVIHLMWKDVAHPDALRTALIRAFGVQALATARPRHNLLAGSGYRAAAA